MKTYKGKDIIVKAFKRGGYFVLRISEYNVYHVATKYSRKSHIEEGWMPEYERKFEAPFEKNRANNYFKKILESHSDMVLIADEPNTYITSEGKKKIY